MVVEERKKWFLKGKKMNGSEQEQTRMVIEGKENEWLLKGKKMNGCQWE